MGELALDKSLGLNSGAFDALTRGISELDELLTELEKSPDLDRKLATQSQLAMRFDAAVARRSAALAKKEISRTEELARLSQLRELNRVYRNLIQNLLNGQTETLLGTVDKTAQSGEEASKQLERATQIVGSRRDYYLFEDEPALEGDDAELKMIQELATPYSDDVLRHQRSLLSVSLCRLALQQNPPNREVLETALAQAEAALADAKAPNSVALYARGLASLELGRLLTSAEPLQQQSHTAAADWFKKSQESLMDARKALPQESNLSELRAELNRLIAEGEEPDVFISRSLELQQQGNSKEAGAILSRGLTRHRNRELAISWIEVRWRAADLEIADLDKLLNDLVNIGLVTTDDPEFLSLRGRVGIQNAWRSLLTADDLKPVVEEHAALLERLLTALTDLKAIPSDAEKKMHWVNAAFIAMGEATALLLDKSRETAEASQALQNVPLVVAELERLNAGRPPHEQQQILEAVQIARMAEGYLALRLVPDYRDRARLAFAAAADARAKLPGVSMALPPVGGAMLRAILLRDESGSDRLAQEERQLRISLQKMLPALVAMQLTEPGTVADSLVGAQRSASKQELTWDPRTQLDPRDTSTARDGLLADSRAVTAIALVSAKKPDIALTILLSDLWPELNLTDLGAVDWNAVRENAAKLPDPFTIYALGFATEEYAISNLQTDSTLRPTLLKNALAMFEQVSVILKTTAVWRERWPYLVSLAETGRERLIDEKAAVNQAKILRAELRLTEARGILEQAQKRHPQSALLLQEFFQALIDEAQVFPDKQQEVLAQALVQLEEAQKRDSELPTSALFALADLSERLGKEAEASRAYREVIERSDSKVEKLKARSRLVVLQAKLAD